MAYKIPNKKYDETKFQKINMTENKSNDMYLSQIYYQF